MSAQTLAEIDFGKHVVFIKAALLPVVSVRPEGWLAPGKRRRRLPDMSIFTPTRSASREPDREIAACHGTVPRWRFGLVFTA
jgi:hypothetical protein